jgi:long-chain-acyl-CoA dehydrogenase
VKECKVFGQPVASYQNTRYKLAEMQTEVQVARVFVDKCSHVPLFGGYGYMWEYPITRAYADAA